MPEKKWRNSHAQTCGTSITNQPNPPRIMRLTSLLAVAALPWAAARTANVRGSQEEHQSVHRAVKENDKKNPKDWRESASISSSPTLSFEDYTMDGCGNDPCGQCAGDCDRDTDCEGDLICFQREDDESVVGCSGDASSGWDYCYDPSGKVTVLAPTPAPAPRFEDYTMDGCGNDPCGQCEGDCDRDTDCEGDLICFQREDDESVAGCIGDASSGWDYCYDPSSSDSAPAPFEWKEEEDRAVTLPSQQNWYQSPFEPPTPRPPPPPSPCKEQSFRGEISPTNYHMAMLGQNNEVHQFFTEAAFPIGIDIDIDIQVMGIDRFDMIADEELNFNFLGVDTNSTGPTPYEVPPSEDDVYFVEVIQRMTRCAEYRLEIRDLQYPFAFLEVYRVGGAAAYQITFSYPSGCDFASKFVYPHDGWVRDETGEEPQKCLGLEFGK